MKFLAGYTLVAFVVVAAAVAVSWSFLEEGGRAGVLVGGVVAFLVQLLCFGLLYHGAGAPQRFMAAWAAGTAIRFLAVAGLAVAVARVDGVDPNALLLSATSLLFLLLLLEPAFLNNSKRMVVRS